MFKQIIDSWPLAQQILHRKDGTGLEARSERTRSLRPKHHDAQVARSVCPYCGVGCAQLVYHKDGKLISIEGNAQSPVSRGRLCPKGSASYELLTHPSRLTKVRYRRPCSSSWDRTWRNTTRSPFSGRSMPGKAERNSSTSIRASPGRRPWPMSGYLCARDRILFCSERLYAMSSKIKRTSVNMFSTTRMP